MTKSRGSDVSSNHGDGVVSPTREGTRKRSSLANLKHSLSSSIASLTHVETWKTH